MHKIVILLFLTVNCLLGQDPIYHDINVDFKNGQQYALFGDDVKFRKKPDVGSKVIDLLAIGTEVEIIEKTTESILYNGLESSFYKVSYDGKTGYILGGLISLETKKSESAIYLFAYKKEEFQYHVLVRTLLKDQSFTELSAPLGNTGLHITLTDNKGISGVQNILVLNNRPESCGVVGGDIYFFETENGLHIAFSTTVFSEAGVNWFNEDLIFPTDEGGVANRIVYQKEKGENGDEESNELHIYKTIRELRWENDQLLPKVAQD